MTTAHLIATYRCIKSTALWFAGQLGSEALQCGGGVTIPATSMEDTWNTSLFWLGELRKLHELQSVRVAVTRCTMTDDLAFTFAMFADTGNECLCPECTLRAMEERRAGAVLTK